MNKHKQLKIKYITRNQSTTFVDIQNIMIKSENLEIFIKCLCYFNHARNRCNMSTQLLMSNDLIIFLF